MQLNRVLNAVDEYAKVEIRTNLESASPHRIILMMLDGAIEKLALGRGAMQSGKTAEKGANISWAISIIDGLRASLNIDQGGQIAQNLDQLYDYMGRTLVDANLHDNPNAVTEVIQLLQEIRAGWAGITPEENGGALSTVNNIGPNAVGVG